MKLEIGKSYRTAEGTEIKIGSVTESGLFSKVGDDGIYHSPTENANFYGYWKADGKHAFFITDNENYPHFNIVEEIST